MGPDRWLAPGDPRLDPARDVGTPDSSQTVRVDAPVTQPAPPGTLNLDELLRQATENAPSGRLCEAPPNEVPEEFKREVEKALASLPIPTTVPSDGSGGVLNIHRRVVPC